MKRLALALALTISLVAIADDEPASGIGFLEYFTEEALATADLEGVTNRIESVLGRFDKTIYAAGRVAERLEGRDRSQILDRIRIAQSLKTYILKRHIPSEREFEILAWQGAEELDCLLDYFREAARFHDHRRKLPEPTVLNLRDFGGRGDGETDDGPAFRQAFEVAKAKDGPVRIVIPSGVWFVKMPTELPLEVMYAWRCKVGDTEFKRKFWPTADRYGRFHLAVADCDDLTIEGEGQVEVRFADATRGGFGFFGCQGAVLKNVTISYAEKPFTQGRIVRVSSEPLGFVFRKDPGYPDPDQPRFVKAHSNRFTAHFENGDVKYDGTGRVGGVRRLSATDFLITPQDIDPKCEYFTRRSAGERCIIIARYSEVAMAYPVYFMVSSFSGAENVRIWASPGQAFQMDKCYANHLYDCTIERRPGSNDLLSDNADGIIAGGTASMSGSIGPYLTGCDFSNGEDDAFNISTFAGRLGSIREDRRWIPGPWFEARFGMIVDGQSGVVKAVVRPSSTERNAFTRPIPENIVTQDMIGKHDPAEFIRRNAWSSNSGEKRPDHLIFVPGVVGAVVRDSKCRGLRGMGGQVHCSNMLIENYQVDHMTGPGLNVNPLFGWGMMFNVHNIIISNVTMKNTSGGVCLRPGAVSKGVEISQKMVQGISISNLKVTGNRTPGTDVIADNTWDVERK